MQWHRIWAVTLRHLRQSTRDFNDLSMTFLMPLINLLVFGYMGIWMAGTIDNPTIKLQILTGIMLLQVLNRSSISLSLSFFEELKSHNITNLFSTPITIHEWLAGSALKALATCGLLVLFLGSCIALLFSVNICTLGAGLLVVTALAFMASMFLGFLAITVLLWWGMNANEAIWLLAAVVTVVSGALYPITVMPPFLQTLAAYLPFLNIFAVLHTLVATGTIAWGMVFKSLLYNVAYLIATYLLVFYSFVASKRRGLERLMD